MPNEWRRNAGRAGSSLERCGRHTLVQARVTSSLPPSSPLTSSQHVRLVGIRTVASTVLAFAVPIAMGARPLAAQRLQFRYITPDDGLASSWVQTIAQDQRGFMWFGTVRGLNRYDGYTLRTYRHDATDSTSVSHARV